jgi:uncharacterized protein YjbI with pentapeptide repeats
MVGKVRYFMISTSGEDEDISVCKVCTGAMILAIGLYLTIFVPVLTTVFPEEYLSGLTWFWTQSKAYVFPFIASILGGYLIKNHVGITIADVAERVSDVNEKLDELLSRTTNETVSVFSRVLLVIVGTVSIVAVIWFVLSVILFTTNAITGLVTGVFSVSQGLIQPISILGGLLVTILLFLGGFVARGWWNGDSEPIESGDGDTNLTNGSENGDTESTIEATESAGDDEETSPHEQASVIDVPAEQTPDQGLEMVSPNGTDCSFTFDPVAWEKDSGTTSPLVGDLLEHGEVWDCPHDAVEGHDRCLFHLPVKDKEPTAVRDSFLSKIAQDGQRPKQFIGARFGELRLDYDIVECGDNYPIDLRHAQFEAATSWRYTIVRQPISFEGAQFDSQPTFTETEFENEVYLNKTVFTAPADFYAAEFTEGVSGNQARFTEANFHRTTFGGPVDLSEAVFENAQFRETTFADAARFTETVFECVAFSGSRFHDRLYLNKTTLPERVSLRQVVVNDLAEIEDVALTDDRCVINCRNATISAGRLYLSQEGTLVYDLTDATLGDVDFVDKNPQNDLFGHYRILNTTFDGFDFGRYRDVLNSSSWQLHDIVDLPELEIEATSPTAGDLEATYLKAKNGANEIGDTKVAAEFFRQEMRFRRKQYSPTIRDSTKRPQTRITAVGRWIANSLLNLTAGYGERPSRVVGVSVGTIAAFASLFAVIRPSPPYETSIGYLILSLESFITLVLGGADTVSDPLIRFLALVEGFVGAFLIALFVFTLTRSIHR